MLLSTLIYNVKVWDSTGQLNFIFKSAASDFIDSLEV